jgi:phosphoribosylformylglycinamidine synthase
LLLLLAEADQYLPVRVNVIVKPKQAVLDPQGNAVRDAMRHLGMPEVRNVRIGKFMEIEVDGENGQIEKRLHVLCRDLLSNPVIEEYELRKLDQARATTEVRASPRLQREQRSELRGRKTEIRGQRSEIGDQRSGVRRRKKK